MIPKFSVKKPMTVLVAVIMVLILGVVSFMGMTTDLLPSLDLPYVLVMTTYPGASPEKVEMAVTKPLEQALATTSGIKNIQSISQENVSIVILEFSQTVNMDSVMIEMSGNIDLAKAALEDSVGAPMMMKLNPDMMPIMMASVDVDGMDIIELSRYINDEVLPAFERIDGVASVNATGLLEQQIHVTLNQSKIDALNDKVLASVDKELADAQQELRDAQKEIADGYAEIADGRQKLTDSQAELEKGESELADKKGQVFDELASNSVQLSQGLAQMNALTSEEATLTAQKAAFNGELQMMNAATDAGMQTLLGQLTNGIPSVSLGIVGQDKADRQTAINGITDSAQQAAEQAKLNADSALSAQEYIKTAMTDARYAELLAAESAKLLAVGVPQAALTPVSALSRTWFASALNPAARIAEINAEMTNIETRLVAAKATKTTLQSQIDKLTQAQKALEAGKLTAVNELTKGEIEISSGKTAMETAKKQLDSAADQLDSAKEQLKDGQKQLDEARDAALKKADLNGIVTQTMLSNILMAQNFSMPAGSITQNGESYTVKVGEKYADVAQLENSLLFNIDAEGVGDIYLSDVADVTLTNNVGDSYAKINGNDGVVISFQKQSTSSTSTVTKAIKKVAAGLQNTNSNMHFTALMDQGVYIDIIINSVLSNLLYGGLLAVLILILFLKDIKPTLIIAFSIPISLLFAVVLMYFSGVTLNIISLSGLALGVGMLVDNSIVVIENIYRLRNEGVPAVKAAVKGAQQVSGAIFASTLTTICVFLPIVFTQGISRQLFTDMGLTIGYSLVASLLVALTVVPAMSAGMLKNTAEKSHPLFDKVIALYEKSLRFTLKHKAGILSAAMALLIFSGVVVTRMGTSFMPSMESDQMSVSMTMEKGTKKADAWEMADTVAQRLADLPDVETVGAMSGGSGGTAMLGLGGGDDTAMSYYVLLSTKRSHTNAQMEQLIKDATADLPCEISVSGNNMDLSALGGSGMSIVVKGRDTDTLRSIANDVADLLAKTPGTVDIDTGLGETTQELRITVNKTQAMRYGFTVAQVYSEIATAVKTENTATILTIGNIDYPVIVITDETNALTSENILEYKLTGTLNGEETDIVLGDIATMETAEGMAAINRDNQSRYVTVTAGIDAAHNIGLVSRDFEKQLAGYTPPEGYTIEISGENETINSALVDLIKMISLAIAFIYLIMVAQFQSLLSPFIVIFTIPLAFTGGLLALLITGSDLSIISMLGFLVLSGVVVNNGIVFVDYVNQLRLGGTEKREALIVTGRTRMRPILMTALTTILAMSTMALGIGSGSDMTQPMAIVTIGGLAYSTFMTLYIVPALYDVFYRKAVKAVDVEDV
ncbi:MAG: efflux RND transporter permease subunit [Oscillospiraceae bacterium]|nr:efflux RND transporter permease subunit [Oscillospiraceae bacterium]